MLEVSRLYYIPRLYAWFGLSEDVFTVKALCLLFLKLKLVKMAAYDAKTNVYGSVCWFMNINCLVPQNATKSCLSVSLGWCVVVHFLCIQIRLLWLFSLHVIMYCLIYDWSKSCCKCNPVSKCVFKHMLWSAFSCIL